VKKKIIKKKRKKDIMDAAKKEARKKKKEELFLVCLMKAAIPFGGNKNNTRTFCDRCFFSRTQHEVYSYSPSLVFFDFASSVLCLFFGALFLHWALNI
jgi:hypothetical protein